MKPRGYLATFLVVAVFSGVAFALLWSALFSLSTRVPFGEVLSPVGIWGGVAFGLIFGAIMGYLLKSEKAVLPVPDRDAFLARLDTALGKMGYRRESQSGSLLVYRPSVKAGILSGKMSVQIEGGSATIVGPLQHVKKLLKKM